MYLRYWALTAAIAGLTYLALSYVLFPVWAVAGGAWIGTFVGFIGVVLQTEPNTAAGVTILLRIRQQVHQRALESVHVDRGDDGLLGQVK